jgi:hypothetical protein
MMRLLQYLKRWQGAEGWRHLLGWEHHLLAIYYLLPIALFMLTKESTRKLFLVILKRYQGDHYR